MKNQSRARGDLVEQSIEKYADMIFRIAFLQTKNYASAEDVFQETFLRLYRSKTEFESEEHVKAWLIRVTINLSRNWRNSAWNKKAARLSEDRRHDLSHEYESDCLEVVEAVKALPSKYRQVIHLFYFEDLTVAEIAKILKSKENTVKSQLSRARKMLEKNLKEVDENVCGQI